MADPYLERLERDTMTIVNDLVAIGRQRDAARISLQDAVQLIDRMVPHLDHLHSCASNTPQTEEICDCGYKSLYELYKRIYPTLEGK